MFCKICQGYGPQWNFPEPGTCFECASKKLLKDILNKIPVTKG